MENPRVSVSDTLEEGDTLSCEIVVPEGFRFDWLDNAGEIPVIYCIRDNEGI